MDAETVNANTAVHPCMLEDSREEIPLSSNRNPILPRLHWAINHPQMPKPNRCIVFEIDLDIEKMRALKEYEEQQEIPNYATDEELREQGQFELPANTPIFSREQGSVDAWQDVCHGWLTPADVFTEEERAALAHAISNAVGDPALVTRGGPVRDEHGNWSGGIALERGDDRCHPVHAGSRCYTLANSYQAPKEVWSPAAKSKVNGHFDEGNKLRRDLILATAPFGIRALNRGPPSVVEIIRNHAAMLNIPPLGLPGNFGYQTLQINIAPAEPFGSRVSLGGSIGPFGLPHRDKFDSAGRLTSMTMASSIPSRYILGKFYIPWLGIYFTLRNFDSVNFCGLNIHGGTPPMAPEGEEVLEHAVRITLIQYPPAAMGDGVGHLAVAAWPGPNGSQTLLKMTAEMQHLDCESRRHRGYTSQANFAQDGQVVNDVRSHATFMARLLLLIVIWILNQTPASYRFRVDSDMFLASMSFEIENGVRESVGPWEAGPGFRKASPSDIQRHDGSDLISQNAVRSKHKQMWRLFFNRCVRHIPYAACAQLGYPINDEGILLEDLEPEFEDVLDALGNPIEKGGRPWKQPVRPGRGKGKQKEKPNSVPADGGVDDDDDDGEEKKKKKRKRSGKSKDHETMLPPGQGPHDVRPMWQSPQYSEMQNIMFSNASEHAGRSLAGALIPLEPSPPTASDSMDVDSLEAEVVIFMQQSAGNGCRLISRLHYATIEREYTAVLEAYENISDPLEYSSEPDFEPLLAGLIHAPHAVETCVHISRAWANVKQMYAEEAKATLLLKLRRQSIMQTTYILWTWLDGYCRRLIEQTLNDPTTLLRSDHWIAKLTRCVRMHMETHGPPRELRSKDFGAALLDETFKLPSRRSFTAASQADICETVLKVICNWMNFPVGGKSRAQALFVQVMVRDCDPSTLYLDRVWFAFGHLESEVFGKLVNGLPTPSACQALSEALQQCSLADRTSEAHAILKAMDALIHDAIRRPAVPLPTPTYTVQHATDRVQSLASPPLLRTPLDDLAQLGAMERFLQYLLELEPLIDGYTNITSKPTALQTYVNRRLDFLLPFREHAPSRRCSRGPSAAFDAAHSATKSGLFSGLIFRGITFASPFSTQATRTLFSDLADWEQVKATFPNPDPFFFCNPYAYSKRKSKRSTALAAEYWNALSAPDCPNWETSTKNGPQPFLDCYNFLKATNPSRFREIGALAGFLLAADFSYAGVVTAPTVDEVGGIIRAINKGGVRGLELLGLVSQREKGSGRSWKMANVGEVKSAFSRLHGFLTTKLTNEQKAHMIFDAIMVENSLCKFSRVVGEKMYVIGNL